MAGLELSALLSIIYTFGSFNGNLEFFGDFLKLTDWVMNPKEFIPKNVKIFFRNTSNASNCDASRLGGAKCFGSSSNLLANRLRNLSSLTFSKIILTLCCVASSLLPKSMSLKRRKISP